MKCRTSAVSDGFKKYRLCVSGFGGEFPEVGFPRAKNAIKVLMGILSSLYHKTEIRIQSISAEGTENAITGEAESVIFVPCDEENIATGIVRKAFHEVRSQDKKSGSELSFKAVAEEKKERAMTDESRDAILGLLLFLPDGAFLGLAETSSTNLFSIGEENGEFVIQTIQFAEDEEGLSDASDTIVRFFEQVRASITHPSS